MLHSLLQGRLPYSLFLALTSNQQNLARVQGYLGALR